MDNVDIVSFFELAEGCRVVLVHEEDGFGGLPEVFEAYLPHKLFGFHFLDLEIEVCDL